MCPSIASLVHYTHKADSVAAIVIGIYKDRNFVDLHLFVPIHLSVILPVVLHRVPYCETPKDGHWSPPKEG